MEHPTSKTDIPNNNNMAMTKVYTFAVKIRDALNKLELENVIPFLQNLQEYEDTFERLAEYANNSSNHSSNPKIAKQRVEKLAECLDDFNALSGFLDNSSEDMARLPELSSIPTICNEMRSLERLLHDAHQDALNVVQQDEQKWLARFSKSSQVFRLYHSNYDSVTIVYQNGRFYSKELIVKSSTVTYENNIINLNLVNSDNHPYSASFLLHSDNTVEFKQLVRNVPYHRSSLGAAYTLIDDDPED